MDAMMLLADKACLAKQEELEEQMKSMHESIHRMFSQQLEDSLASTRERIAAYVKHRIAAAIARLNRIKAIWERTKTDVAAERFGSHFVVGGRDGAAQWECVDLCCGHGATSLWLAQHTACVLALDTRD
eukprot:CAMPEP_0202842340 /NCGR_PEP_ID=MMETSP1389-20130828/61194_1 /ASSEMBLY_ACC=CAM_ASM_000865 /TAXON_ID=302021 /ORGANISM="Rhodomonas sp., Strain CCMP768" /LENGTH=128 /DNA_ID=CAMNT_0049519289 /DNA_START=66 /DNA_END=449 /DNA_ORIENTATION=-